MGGGTPPHRDFKILQTRLAIPLPVAAKRAENSASCCGGATGHSRCPQCGTLCSRQRHAGSTERRAHAAAALRFSPSRLALRRPLRHRFRPPSALSPFGRLLCACSAAALSAAALSAAALTPTHRRRTHRLRPHAAALTAAALTDAPEACGRWVGAACVERRRARHGRGRARGGA